jgi:hypothetical protein
MPLRPRTVFALVLLAAFVGCGASGPPRAPIQGAVTVAGQPLAAGRIVFVPVTPNEGPATTARIVNGKYELPHREGPVVGTNRVEVAADVNLGFALDDEQAFAKYGRRMPPNPIPPQYNQQSQLVVEVAEDTENTFNVAVPVTRQMVGR